MNRTKTKSRTRRAVLPNGFTLMELLIVMAIITILMLLAIPTFSALRRQGNRLSAMASIRAIQEAETMYASNYPTNGFACSLSALGGDSSAGVPSPTAAQFLKSDITSGFKDGYIFAITNCTKVTASGTDRITSYTITAVPQTIGKTGDSGFCSDDNGLKSDPAGGTNCTQPVQ
jgi:type IV pilus assembly protein PilA